MVADKFWSVADNIELKNVEISDFAWQLQSGRVFKPCIRLGEHRFSPVGVVRPILGGLSPLKMF